MWDILRRDGIDFHPESSAALRYVPHFSFGANLAFLDQEVHKYKLALFLSCLALQKEARGTKVANPRNVTVRCGFPIYPDIIDGGNARGSPPGGTG